MLAAMRHSAAAILIVSKPRPPSRHVIEGLCVRVLPASITFEVDAKGKVTGLVLHQGSLDQRAQRK
jgi:hypothetical protein